MKPLIAELNMNRRIGCEIEMAVPLVGSGGGREVQETLARVLTANGLRAKARGYSNAPVARGFKLAVEHDASVRGESRFDGIAWHACEVKTTILDGLIEWESIVPRTLEICRYMGARVNRSTGFHVHMDFPEATEQPTKIRSLYNLVHRFEPLIYSIIAPSRRSNGYARPLDPDASRLLHGCHALSSFRRALANWDRHRGLNLIHVFEPSPSPRIEFRWHHGTLDADKARHWLRFLNRLVEHAMTRNCQAARKQVEPSLPAFDNFLMTIGLRSNTGIYAKVSPELRETAKYLRRRFQHFAGISKATPDAQHEGEE